MDVAAHPPAGRRDAGRRACRGARVQRRSRGRRLPRATPDTAPHRLRCRDHGDGPRQGRRRHAPRQHGPARVDDAGAGARDSRGHRGAPRVLRDPDRGERGVHPRPRHHARAPARPPPLAEAPDRQRGGDRRAHRHPRLAALHAASRHRRRRRRCPRHPPARAHHAGGGRGRRGRALRGPQAPPRRRRALRGGGRRHHPAGRRRGPHDHCDALPQCHRSCGAPRARSRVRSQ